MKKWTLKVKINCIHINIFNGDKLFFFYFILKQILYSQKLRPSPTNIQMVNDLSNRLCASEILTPMNQWYFSMNTMHHRQRTFGTNEAERKDKIHKPIAAEKRDQAMRLKLKGESWKANLSRKLHIRLKRIDHILSFC